MAATSRKSFFRLAFLSLVWSFRLCPFGVHTPYTACLMKISPSVSSNRSISNRVMMRGGTNRSTRSPVPLIRMPRAKHSLTMVFPSISSFHPLQEPEATHLSHHPVSLLYSRIIPLQNTLPLGAHDRARGLPAEPAHGQTSRASERIAAECRGMAAGRKGLRDRICCETGSDGHAAPQPFRQGHDVRLHPQLLVSEQRSSASHPGLYFIEHQQHIFL